MGRNDVWTRDERESARDEKRRPHNVKRTLENRNSEDMTGNSMYRTSNGSSDSLQPGGRVCSQQIVDWANNPPSRGLATDTHGQPGTQIKISYKVQVFVRATGASKISIVARFFDSQRILLLADKSGSRSKNHNGLSETQARASFPANFFDALFALADRTITVILI